MERKRSVKRRQKQPLAQRAKEQCRKFTAFMFSNVGIIILVVLYMTAGAFMFTAIEGSIALERWAEIARNRQTLAHHLWNVSSCELNGLNRSMFEEEVGKKILDYQQTIVRAARKGWPGSDARGEGRKQWSFSGAFLYSLTVITTIGYGNLAPRTEWGKVATILYAIIGMPLFLLYLSNIGDIFAKSFKWIYAKVCLCRICPGVAKRRAIRQRRKQIRARTLYSSESEDEDSIRNPSQSRDYHVKGVLDGLSSNNSYSTQMSDDDDFEDAIEKEIEGATSTVTVPLTICLMIMIGYIIIGATIFGRWEDWNMLDGCYFCFISLSSIGFGDIVPGEEIMQISKGINSGVELRFILCAVYLLLGMALIAMCFNLMQEQVIHKMRSFKRGIRRCFHCDR